MGDLPASYRATDQVLESAQRCVTRLSSALSHSQRQRIAGLVLAATTLEAGLTRAAEPAANQAEDRFESAVIPALAGDTDVGLKFGGVGQLARFEDGLRPYAWRAQALILLSVLDEPTGFAYPYREVFAWFDEPHLGWSWLRLVLAASYFRTTNLGYYGIGNDLEVARPWEAFDEKSEGYALARHFYQYDGTSVFAQGAALFTLAPNWVAYAGVKLDHSDVDPYDGTLLDQHRAAGPVRGEELHGVGVSTRLIQSWGIVFDTRDHETVTTEGLWHELGFRGSPAFFDAEPYMGMTLVLRGYASLMGEQLSVGSRAVLDAVSRRAPLSELGRFGSLESRPGPAGAQGIRGVPQGRLHGRTKFIGNVEARSLVLPFSLLGEHAVLGAAAFFDFGRVWSGTFESDVSLDGDGLGLHWGSGVGPRLRYGDTLLLRCDVAYAPLGAELGSAPAVYVDIVHVL